MAVFSSLFLLERRQFLLPGETSDGHFLIEQSCSSCHGGFEVVKNEDCQSCHSAELAQDTHPVRVFEDPRWASDLEELDAMQCLTCHLEHQTAEGGATIHSSFCFPCHDDVIEKRPTHVNLSRISCGNSGCHNYHDNSALNTAYLAQRAEQPNLLPDAGLPRLTMAPQAARSVRADHPSSVQAEPALVESWSSSRHALAGVNCTQCHQSESGEFVVAAPTETCASCHQFETDTFHAGKHGVLTSLGLPPLTPKMARLPMAAKGPERPSHLSCATCHDPHSVDIVEAATQSCLRCHADEHSLSFEGSPHAELANRKQPGEPAMESLTCASCHLPRVKTAVGAQPGETRIAVNHNNAWTLRPTDRMAKLVCTSCHGLELSLSSIYDRELVRDNFRAGPKERHPSFPMIEQMLAAQAPTQSAIR